MGYILHNEQGYTKILYRTDCVTPSSFSLRHDRAHIMSDDDNGTMEESLRDENYESVSAKKYEKNEETDSRIEERDWKKWMREE